MCKYAKSTIKKIQLGLRRFSNELSHCILLISSRSNPFTWTSLMSLARFFVFRKKNRNFAVRTQYNNVLDCTFLVYE